MEIVLDIHSKGVEHCEMKRGQTTGGRLGWIWAPATHAAAGALQGSGKYIEHAKLSGMAHDVAAVIKNHPVPTMLICFGIGYCVARALKE